MRVIELHWCVWAFRPALHIPLLGPLILLQETSTWARQEHNGFSHQNPSFIGAVLNLKPKLARVYLPPDANCFLSTVAHCLRAKVGGFLAGFWVRMVGGLSADSGWSARGEIVGGLKIWARPEGK